MSACAPKSEDITKEIISSKQVLDIMADARISAEFFGGEIILDREYGLPSEKWIESYFYPLFWKEFSTTYRSESNDCDDFAGHARSLVQKLNNQTSNVGKRAVAFGECHYQTDRGTHHAINFAIVKKNDKHEVIFFEPQNGFVVKLSEKEFNSIWFWMI